MTRVKMLFSALILGMVFAFPVSIFAQDTMMKNPNEGVQSMEMHAKELVPLRQAAEKLGYDVMWKGKTQTITLTWKAPMMGGMSMGTMGEKPDMMEDQSMIDMTDPSMMKDQTMDDMKDQSMGTMEDKSMDDRMDMKGKSYTVVIMIGSNTVVVGGTAEETMYMPELMKATTYVDRGFIDTYINVH